MGLVSRIKCLAGREYRLFSKEPLYCKDKTSGLLTLQLINLPKATRYISPCHREPEGLGSSVNSTRGGCGTLFQKSHQSPTEEPGALVQGWLLTLVLAALSESHSPVRYVNHSCDHTDPPSGLVCRSSHMEDTLEGLASLCRWKASHQFTTSSTTATALFITSIALQSWALYCWQQQILKVLQSLNIYHLSVCQANITRGGSGNYRR